MISLLGSLVFCMASTIICYMISLKIYRKYKKNWLNPLYTSTIFILAFLLLFHIPYQAYQQGSFIFEQLLQLSIVAFAVPLYKQWPLLMKNFKKIFSGVLAGTILGILSVFLMSQLFHFNHEVLASLIPRSVTLPIALSVSNGLGGATTITVFFVLFSGLFSVICGPHLLKKAGITSKAAKGLAMGTSAQMLGANRSLLWGDEEGALGCIAMTTSAIFLSVMLPLLLILI
ncbi:LrgB family protein [Peribacillus glennii]|uniref:LrgB family protein n=1 Tax=Peribacillus glennii TaxID=2303991 RepID=A0A372LJM9_9BACI|nr:LrgB family protein [Peribacillus glennii]RFU66648.1 LrgB family protein [Peribacillus glennii]